MGGFPSGPLELVRTQELVARWLPGPPAAVLDVGGGPGVHAGWLATAGYQVHVVDPVPLHVDQAGACHPQVTAELGDARQLSQADSSTDVVLLLGPLYHLVERRDRMAALHEARRVLRPGGMLFVAGISRFAGLFDLLIRLDRLHEPPVGTLVRHTVATGVHEGAEHGLFTTAYFHRPDELRAEVADAELDVVELLNVEGPGFVIQDFETRWADPARRDAILDAARLVETEPTLMGMSSHLLVVARRPSQGLSSSLEAREPG